MRFLRSEPAFAALVVLLALALYVRTLYPGLVGDGDTPKFQYVGAVLGTPHNPGYPLYLVLSYAFSRLPMGSLAWRINLMSAVCAALAIALLALLQRALGCSRGVSAAVALGAACGPIFWSQATLAEVYTLAAALLLGVLLPLVRWAHTRRPGLLLVAAGVFALALGHHLTIVVLAPALLLYALLVDRRAALAPRRLALVALLQVLGLCQYLLILVRTRQGAPYLGSQARTLPELLDVMRGAQFGDRLFAYDAATLWRERLPLVVGLLRDELGLVGLALCLLGLGLLLRRRAPEGPLLALGALGVSAFALVYKVDDTHVFLVPAFMLLWPAVGVSLQAIVDALRTALGARPQLRAALAIPLTLALPLAQFGGHFKASDHSDRTFELRYFRKLAERVPPGSVFLAESYTVDQMLLYELLGEGFARTRGLRLVPRDAQTAEVYARRGRPVYAFGRARQELAPQGFRFESVRAGDGPLFETLPRLPAGFQVLLAGAPASPGLRAAAAALGAGVPEWAPAFALIVTTGTGAPNVHVGPPPLEVRLDTTVGTLHAVVDGQGARLLLNGNELVRSTRGAAAAWLNPRGRLVEALDLDPRGSLAVPFGRRAFPLYRITSLPDGSPAAGER